MIVKVVYFSGCEATYDLTNYTDREEFLEYLERYSCEDDTIKIIKGALD